MRLLSRVLSAGIHNDSAGNLFAGISCWLGCKIVRHIVDHHGFAYDFRNRKAVCKKKQESVAVIAEQRRHITGMVWMEAIRWIVMGKSICKRVRGITGATGTTVNVKAKNRILAWLCV